MADDRVARRAQELTDPERLAGTDDAEAQAEAILAESDERQADRDAAPTTYVEHRTSDEATAPAETAQPEPD
ncbi:MAG: hypothetical protein QOK43_2708 [Acidimicrobiaceae bacterium]|jgi:hypothetical protein|nr:hypothetical protein [Acidimicrobiaceae bacterium]